MGVRARSGVPRPEGALLSDGRTGRGACSEELAAGTDREENGAHSPCTRAGSLCGPAQEGLWALGPRRRPCPAGRDAASAPGVRAQGASGSRAGPSPPPQPSGKQGGSLRAAGGKERGRRSRAPGGGRGIWAPSARPRSGPGAGGLAVPADLQVPKPRKRPVGGPGALRLPATVRRPG